MKVHREYWAATDETFRALASFVQKHVPSLAARGFAQVAELVIFVTVLSSGDMAMKVLDRSSVDTYPTMPKLVALAIRSAIAHTPAGKIPILVLHEAQSQLAAYVAPAATGEPPDENGAAAAPEPAPSELAELKAAVDAFLDMIGGLTPRIGRDCIMFAAGVSGGPIAISLLDRDQVILDPDMPAPLREAALATIQRTPPGCLSLVSMIDVGEQTRIRGSLVATEGYLASAAKA